MPADTAHWPLILVSGRAVGFFEPDADLAIVDRSSEEEWNSKILAIVSCRTSFRIGIAQACYWKLKLLSSYITEHVRVFLDLADNNKDFVISNTSRRSKKRTELCKGRSRDRVTSYYELDRVYVLNEDFIDEWESEKVKKY